MNIYLGNGRLVSWSKGCLSKTRQTAPGMCERWSGRSLSRLQWGKSFLLAAHQVRPWLLPQGCTSWREACPLPTALPRGGLFCKLPPKGGAFSTQHEATASPQQPWQLQVPRRLSSPPQKPSCSEDLLQRLRHNPITEKEWETKGKRPQPATSDSGSKAGHHPLMFALINVPVNFKHWGRISRLCRSFKSLRDYQTSHLK